MSEVSTARVNLARLLATENISVSMSPNAPTAYFDVKSRQLVVPNWKIDDTTLVMLIAHEVGHARFTPSLGWHNTIKASKLPGLMQTILNICEDARIEKLMQRAFRGLKKDFVEGYKFLSTLKEFGEVAKISKKQIKEAGLADRVNLEFKFGSIIDVPFTKSERKLVDEVGSSETFEDVVVVALKIYKKLAKNIPDMNDLLDQLAAATGTSAESLLESLSEQSGETEDGEASEGDDGESSEDGEASEGDDGESSEDGEKSEKSQNSAGSGKSEDDEKINQNDEDTSITEKLEAGTKNLKTMDDTKTIVDANSDKDFFFKTASKETVKRIMLRESSPAKMSAYIKTSAAIVNNMVGIFQQKQAAKSFARIRENKTGIINPDKISKYKITEDIFLRNSEVQAGKNHGIVLVLDMSGSMGGIFQNTVRQMIMVTEFCRKLNIPYSVFGVNDTKSWADWGSLSEDGKNRLKPADERPAYLVPLWSSLDKRPDQIDMMNAVGFQGKKILGGTPLTKATVSLIGEVTKFKKMSKAEIVDVIYLTDGDASDRSLGRRSSNENFVDAEYGSINCFQDALRVLRLKQKVNVTNLNLVDMKYYSYMSPEQLAQKMKNSVRVNGNEGFTTWIDIDTESFGFREKVEGETYESLEESFSSGAEAKKKFRGMMNLVAEMIASEGFIPPAKKVVDNTKSF